MRRQYVLSAPGKVFVEQYTTKSGQKKNRYAKNPEAKIVKSISHYEDSVFGK